MCLKLQRNFEVIQYLVKDASPEQLIWRRDEDSWSLEDILCRLRDEEMWHARVQVPTVAWRNHFSSPPADFKSCSMTAGKDAFEAYAYYRRKTVALLENVSLAQWQGPAIHKFFGEGPLTELVDLIDEHDQMHIHQLEDVIHDMPLNPLFARALQEISDYHRRYQHHLSRAASLLDIGVGVGLALQHVMQQNPHLDCAGVDIRNLRLPDVEVPLQVYDGQTLPFVTNQFDLSLIFYVLHHCREPQRLLDEALRVTRQKLIIIEEFHHPDADVTSLDLTERESHRALGIPPDLPYRPFDQPDFETMLRERQLIELEQQLLPSKTTRPVQKYLYVVQVT